MSNLREEIRAVQARLTNLIGAPKDTSLAEAIQKAGAQHALCCGLLARWAELEADAVNLEASEV